MPEHHISVPRTARYVTLGNAAAPPEIWFVLHGYGQLAARFIRQFAVLDEGTRLIVAPEALSRFYLEGGGTEKIGASWMTREDRLTEIADYVRYLDAVYVAVGAETTPRVVVLGFSQGTAAAARWLAMGSSRADRLILWGGEVPPDLDLAAARARWTETSLTLVVGSTDQYITPKVLARDEERLRSDDIRYHVERFAGGHEIPTDILARVAAR